MCDRGWLPPNRALLNHPMLTDDTGEEPSVESVPTTNTNNSVSINVDTGMGAAVLDQLLAHRSRSEAGIKAKDERKRKGADVTENLKNAKRLTTGIMVKEGIHSPNDPRYLEAVNEKEEDANEKMQEQALQRRNKKNKIFNDIKALRSKHGDETMHNFKKFTISECGTYLQYKKQSKKDGAMPKTLQERKVRCMEWRARPSPVPSPNASDDEDNNDVLFGGDDAAAAAEQLGLNEDPQAEDNCDENRDDFGDDDFGLGGTLC